MSKIHLSVFVTAQSVIRAGETPEKTARLVADLKDVGAEKAFLEVWRGGGQAPSETMRSVRDACLAAGLKVATGIMPVAGRDPTLEGTPDWDSDETMGGNSRWGADICYSKPHSLETLKTAMRAGAELFDEFIIDDALCTQCTCSHCRAARGDRDWFTFRQDTLVDVSREILVGACREVNPDIKMILKYPQWYDRLRNFGYDTARQPAEFDATWIGTETRDPDTPDFGFVPQYEAFFNTRWHGDAEPNLEGCWFDYIECDPFMYAEQAYQSALGGMQNMTLFCYGESLFGGNGYLLAALKAARPHLETVAERIEGVEPTGLVTVRPHNPAPIDDGYIFDGMGMIGVPLVPKVEWPATPPKALLVTDHVATDPALTDKVAEVVEAGGTAFITASALAQNDDDARLKELAGLASPGWSQSNHWFSDAFRVGGTDVMSSEPVEFRFDLRVTDAEVLAEAAGVAHHRDERIPVVTRHEHPSAGAVVVLNIQGVCDRDYHMDENLNVPAILQMQLLPAAVVNVIQEQVAAAIGGAFRSPARVSYHPFENGIAAVQNFTNDHVFAVPIGDALPEGAEELLGMATITTKDGVRGVRIPERSIALIAT